MEENLSEELGNQLTREEKIKNERREIYQTKLTVKSKE